MNLLGRIVRILAGVLGLSAVLVAILNSPRATPTEWAMILPLVALALMASVYMITKD